MCACELTTQRCHMQGHAESTFACAHYSCRERSSTTCGCRRPWVIGSKIANQRAAQTTPLGALTTAAAEPLKQRSQVLAGSMASASVWRRRRRWLHANARALKIRHDMAAQRQFCWGLAQRDGAGAAILRRQVFRSNDLQAKIAQQQ